MNFFISLFLILLSFTAQAKPLTAELHHPNQLQLVIHPTSPKVQQWLAPKTVSVTQKGSRYHLSWQSQSKTLSAHSPWPEYRVVIKKGVIKTQLHHHATRMVHPHLWQTGLYHLEKSSSLWMTPKIFDLPKKQTLNFEPGLIHFVRQHYRKGPGEFVYQIGQWKKKLKSATDWLETFSQIKIVSRHKNYTVLFNNEKRKLPTTIVGNNFVRYTVLKSRSNPLVLKMEFFSDGAPENVLGDMKYFEKNFGYEVREIYFLKIKT